MIFSQTALGPDAGCIFSGKNALIYGAKVEPLYLITTDVGTSNTQTVWLIRGFREAGQKYPRFPEPATASESHLPEMPIEPSFFAHSIMRTGRLKYVVDSGSVPIGYAPKNCRPIKGQVFP